MDRKIILISVTFSALVTALLYLLIGAVNQFLIPRIPPWAWIGYFSVTYLIIYHGLMQCQPNTVITCEPRRRS